MNCYVSNGEIQEQRSGSSIYRNRYYNSEADFCRVYSEDVLLQLERLFLWNQISYFIVEEHANVLSRVFSMRKHSWMMRINQNDLEYALWLVEGLRGVEVIAEPPARDWTPTEAKREREAYGGSTGYFSRYRGVRQ